MTKQTTIVVIGSLRVNDNIFGNKYCRCNEELNSIGYCIALNFEPLGEKFKTAITDLSQ